MHLATSVIHEFERLGKRRAEKPDPRTYQIARVQDVIQIVQAYHFPTVYIDLWDEHDPSEVESCMFMNEPEAWNNIPFLFVFYSPRSQYFYVAREGDPSPDNPLIFYVDHDGSDVSVLGSVDQFPNEETSIGRLSDLLADLDGQARSELNGAYYADLLDAELLDEESSVDDCQKELARIAQLEMTACDRMSYWLFLAELQVRQGDVSSAKVSYATFLQMRRDPLRDAEKEMLRKVMNALESANR